MVEHLLRVYFSLKCYKLIIVLGQIPYHAFNVHMKANFVRFCAKAGLVSKNTGKP